MNRDGETLWTIGELGGRVAEALSAGGYEGVTSGRVRDVPDPRTIRYYTTIGLLDRPEAFRGRTALYGPRHLLQLVAIKRLQSDGLSLAEVQKKVAGASDVILRDLGRTESETEQSGAPWSPPGPRRRPDGRGAFWKERPAPAPAVSGPPSPPLSAVPLQGVGLGPDATLLLRAIRAPDGDDLRVIRLAAAPLLELLRMRGLIGPDGVDESPPSLPPEEAP